MVNSLNETIELMTSSDYKDRFKAEYYQLEYRYNKLKKMLEDWDADKLSFTPTCNRDITHHKLFQWAFTSMYYVKGQKLRMLNCKAIPLRG